MINQSCTHRKECSENGGVLIIEHIFSGDKSKTEIIQVILEHMADCEFQKKEIEN